ncbi:hypothetical protein GWC77_24075 [Paraburkholderia sp. NMBU_R16]|uniref:type III secretion protein HrpB4 n=1 Tax=Paraburkholderia sp. NMBU_R16 TaxID=2698676 RepID=UPI001565B0CD|nr:hypothetical protein [Paraburkholderia sp. NMBU_R16]
MQSQPEPSEQRNPQAACAETAPASLAGSVTPGAADIASRLTTYVHRRQTLFEWMHPLRLACLSFSRYLHVSNPTQSATLAQAFLEQAGLPEPPLSAFASAGTALALLPLPACLCVCRLRALLAHVNELRTWIDRPRRAQLREWVGELAASLIYSFLPAPTAGHVPDADPLPAGEGAGDLLAWRGLQLLERDYGWNGHGPLALAQFALPVDSCAESCPPPLPHRDLGASAWIAGVLPKLFPEQSW